jgi:MFS transporter, FHS family, L-fucose permease
MVVATAKRGNTRDCQSRVFVVTAGLFVVSGLALWLYNALFFKLAQFFSFTSVRMAAMLALFHVSYILFALSAGLFHRQFGYKLGVLSGLNIFALGAFLFYLAIIQHSGVYFLASVAVIGASGGWLDTALNPMALGSGPTAVARLNLAHAFNGLGLLLAISTVILLLGNGYQLISETEAQSSARPYVVVGLGAIFLAYLIEQIHLPDNVSKGTATASNIRAEIRGFLRDKPFGLAAGALSAYCVVLTILWTANYKYHLHEVSAGIMPLLERGPVWFVIGRFAGTVLMRWIDPVRLLQWCAGLCLAAIAGASAFGGNFGWECLLSASLFLSITYPTVFGTALGGHRQGMALAACIMVVAAGIGNAVSSSIVCLALNTLNLNARIVVLAALPFETVILFFALRAAAPTSASAKVDRTGRGDKSLPSGRSLPGA